MSWRITIGLALVGIGMVAAASICPAADQGGPQPHPLGWQAAPVSGTVTIVQTLNPGSALAPHGAIIVDEHHTIEAGQRRTFGVGRWYIARDSEITVSFTGDITAWAPANPFTVTVDRRD